MAKKTLEKVISKETVSKGEVHKNSMPADVDSKFENFLRYFSKDSLFQISRINFPLKVKNIGDDGEDEAIISQSSFRKLTFGDTLAQLENLINTKKKLK